MADRVVRAVLTGSSAGAVRAFEETGTAAERAGHKASSSIKNSNDTIGSSFTGMAGKVGSVIGGLALGATGLAAIGAVGAKVFGDYQAALAKLNTSMSDAGQKWTPELHDQFEKVSGSMVKVGFDTSATADAMAKLVTAGIPASAAMQDMGVAADLARFKNIGLSDATDTLIKASQGSLRALRDLGITQGPVIVKAQAMTTAQNQLATAQQKLTGLQQSATATHKQLAAAQDAVAKAQANVDAKQKDYNQTYGHFNQIIDLVGPKVKGQADAYAHTLPGALQVLKASISDKLLVPLGEKLMPLFIQLSSWIGEHSGDISNVLAGAVTVLGQAFDVATGAISAIFDALQPVFKFVVDNWNMLGPIFLALGGAILGIVVAFEAWKKIQGIIAEVSKAMTLMATTNPLILLAVAIGAAAVLIITHWDQVKQFLQVVGDWLENHFGAQINALKTIVGVVVDFISDHWKLLVGILMAPVIVLAGIVYLVATHFDEIKGAVSGFIQTVAGIIGAVVGIFRQPFEDAFRVVNDVFNVFKDLFTGKWSDLGKDLASLVGDWFHLIIDEFIAGLQLLWLVVESIGPTLAGLLWDGIKAIPALIGQGIDLWIAAFKLELDLLWKLVVFEFTQLPDYVWTGFLAVIGLIGQLFTGLAQGFAGGFVALWQSVSGPIDTFVANVVMAVASIPSKIAGALRFLGGAVWAGMKAMLNDVIAGINRFIGIYDSALGPVNAVLGFFGIPTLTIPPIPSLDVGGAVMTTGLAIVHRGEVFSGIHGETPLPMAGRSGGSVSTSVVINVMGGDPQAVVNALKAYMRTNGALPVTVNAATRLGAA